MRNQSLDGLEWSALDFPYNRIQRELSEEPRLVAGNNSYVTLGGKLVKRPGTIAISNTTISKRMDNMWLYETLESPPKVYIVGSFFNATTSVWELYYNRLDGSSPGWVAMPELRQSQHSTRAHEAVVSRGKLYIKGYPSAASGEKLGTIIFDGSGSGTPSTTLWGLLGPQTPARISGVIHRLSGALAAPTVAAPATTLTLDSYSGLPSVPFNLQIDYELVTAVSGTGPYTILRGAQGTTPAAHDDRAIVLYRDWGTPTHVVVVNLFWEYSYAYETITGQVSNRAAAETNPDNMPSSTGPFLNLIPKITVQGQADTTNIPYIRIYRTTDGGGTFLFLEKITNTGSGSITYEDKSLLSGSSTHNDPVPDKDLNTQSPAPTLTSNSPMPTVISPLVTGTDTPAGNSTPIAYYAGRFWIGLGNYLFYSANEELNVGIPEESFPSGFLGNFFLFQHTVQELVGTTDALYITTDKDTYALTGTLRETFNPKPILNDIGSPYGHSRAATRYQDAMIWLTNDLRIAILQGNNFRVSSDPLSSDIVDLINAGGKCDIKYWADLEKEFIAVALHNTTTTSSRQLIYDIKKSVQTKSDFWNTPWTIRSTAMASGRIRESETQRRLLFFVWTGSSGQLCRLASLTSENTGTDDVPGAAGTAFDFSVDTALFQTPPGNHINALRRPALYPIVTDVRIERTKFIGDVDPTVSYFVDDFWTSGTVVSPNTVPPRAQDPKGYKTLIFPINICAKHVALRIALTGSDKLFEIQNLAFIFEPDKGV